MWNEEKWARLAKLDAVCSGYATTVDDSGGCTNGNFVVQICSDTSVSFLSLQSRCQYSPGQIAPRSFLGRTERKFSTIALEHRDGAGNGCRTTHLWRMAIVTPGGEIFIDQWLTTGEGWRRGQNITVRTKDSLRRHRLPVSVLQVSALEALDPSPQAFLKDEWQGPKVAPANLQPNTHLKQASTSPSSMAVTAIQRMRPDHASPRRRPPLLRSRSQPRHPKSTPITQTTATLK